MIKTRKKKNRDVRDQAGPIFVGKKGGARYQGVVTADGAVGFEAARRALVALWLECTGVKRAGASDGDTVEYLARGPEASRAYILEHHRK